MRIEVVNLDFRISLTLVIWHSGFEIFHYLKSTGEWGHGKGCDFERNGAFRGSIKKSKGAMPPHF